MNKSDRRLVSMILCMILTIALFQQGVFAAEAVSDMYSEVPEISADEGSFPESYSIDDGEERDESGSEEIAEAGDVEVPEEAASSEEIAEAVEEEVPEEIADGEVESPDEIIDESAEDLSETQFEESLTEAEEDFTESPDEETAEVLFNPYVFSEDGEAESVTIQSALAGASAKEKFEATPEPPRSLSGNGTFVVAPPKLLSVSTYNTSNILTFSDDMTGVSAYRIYILCEDDPGNDEAEQMIVGSKTYYIDVGPITIPSSDVSNMTVDNGSICRMIEIETDYAYGGPNYLFGLSSIHMGQESGISNLLSGNSEYQEEPVIPAAPVIDTINITSYGKDLINATVSFKSTGMGSFRVEVFGLSENKPLNGTIHTEDVSGKIYYVRAEGVGYSNKLINTTSFEGPRQLLPLQLNITNGPLTNGEALYFGAKTVRDIPGGSFSSSNFSNLKEVTVSNGETIPDPSPKPQPKPASTDRPMKNCSVILPSQSYVYTGKPIMPLPTVKYKSSTLTSGTHYTVQYLNNVKAGTASIVITGKGIYKNSITKTFTIKKATDTISAAPTFNCTTAKKKKTYKLSASTIGGKLSFTSSNKKIPVDANGKITVPKNYMGQAIITVTSAATANCEKSSKKITVNVNPKKTKISKAKNLKKLKASVKWKKGMPKKISGYQICYSTDKNFKEDVKTVTIKGRKKASKIIKNLTKGKTYYFRIRTYKKTGGVRLVSAWSKKKKVKIKK